MKSNVTIPAFVDCLMFMYVKWYFSLTGWSICFVVHAFFNGISEINAMEWLQSGVKNLTRTLCLWSFYSDNDDEYDDDSNGLEVKEDKLQKREKEGKQNDIKMFKTEKVLKTRI